MVLCSPWLGGPGTAFADRCRVSGLRSCPRPRRRRTKWTRPLSFSYLDHVVVGTTHAIQGEIAIDRAHPDQSVVGPIRVDLRTLKTDAPNRDNALQTPYLESAKYPTAVFTSTRIYGIPDAYADGRDVQVEVLGTLMMHGVAKPEGFTGTVHLAGNTLTGTLSTMVQWTDFSMESPTILGQRVVGDEVTLTVQFVAARESATPH